MPSHDFIYIFFFYLISIFTLVFLVFVTFSAGKMSQIYLT